MRISCKGKPLAKQRDRPIAAAGDHRTKTDSWFMPTESCKFVGLLAEREVKKRRKKHFLDFPNIRKVCDQKIRENSYKRGNILQGLLEITGKKTGSSKPIRNPKRFSFKVM